MEKLKTKAWSYNQAWKDFQEYKGTCTIDEVKEMLEMQIEGKNERENEESFWRIVKTLENKHLPHLRDIRNEMERAKQVAYLREMAKICLSRYELPQTEENIRRIEYLAYNCNQLIGAEKTLLKYKKMFEEGYISLFDVTENDHNKTAIMTYREAVDWFTTTAKDKKIKIYCKDGKVGYRTPRMRSRFYVASLDADYFIKIID